MTELSPIDRQVTERVIRCREAAGLTKAELADRLGLSKSGYTPYENFRAPFSVAQLQQISAVLGHSVAYFLGIDCRLTPDEDEVLTTYRAIPDATSRGMARRALKVFLREG